MKFALMLFIQKMKDNSSDPQSDGGTWAFYADKTTMTFVEDGGVTINFTYTAQ